MPEEPCIVAVSADYARIEAALVDTAGRVVEVEAAPLRGMARGGGASQLNPAALYDTVVGVIGSLLERKPREAGRVMGLSLIGRSPSVAAVGPDGARNVFLRPVEARSLVRGGIDVPWDEVYQSVGLTAKHCAIPYIMRAFAGDGDFKFLTPKDFLKWSLTGEYSTDPLDAQRTFLYDICERKWSPRLCEIFGVSIDRLPPVKEPTEAAGAVTREAARATGLKEGLPVACGMGDWGEYLGTGCFALGDAFEHIGSTGAFYGVTDKRPDASLGLQVRPHLSNGLYLAGREGLPGGECLEWLLKKSLHARGGEIDWPAVDEELEAIAAMGRPENVLFFPALREGTRQIEDAAFMNLHIEDDLTSLIQGLIEGLFLNLKSVAEKLEGIPWTLRAVYTTGQIGFKHAPRRTRANIYDARIYAGRAPGANVTSAALVGAVACGACRDIGEARERILNVDGGVGPVEEVSRLYEGHFASWLGTRDFLAPGGRG